MISLRELLNGIHVLKTEGTLDLNIESIYYNSKQVTDRSLFFCLEGQITDGHRYAAEAAKKGAVAVVISKDVEVPSNVTKIFVDDTRLAMAYIAKNFYKDPGRDMSIIGVTGTNGKTTTTYLIKSILEQWGKKVGLIGTITNIIGDKKIPTERTTPESVDLYKLLYEMKKSGVDAVVMEVSSHSLELNRVAGCKFDVGVFTNLSQDHLDFHGTLENYRNSKAKLFKMCNSSVINTDDDNGKIIVEGIDGEIITYGIKNNAQVYARDIEITAKGVAFSLYVNKGKIDLNLNIPGIFSVYNSMAAASVASSLGVPADIIKKGLEVVKGVSGRFELLDTGTDYSVILDFAHTPDGLENILTTAKELTKGRIVTLFGCGGDRDAAKRPLMGEVAGRYSDFCIITSDNPRNEEPMDIINDIIPGVLKTSCPYVVISNRKEAIKYAIENAKKDDLIILAGKGHETYQIIKDKVYHLDEREIVANLLGKEIV